jgi:hypothetical protein
MALGTPPSITIQRGATGGEQVAFRPLNIEVTPTEEFYWAPNPSTCLLLWKKGFGQPDGAARVFDAATGKQVGRTREGLPKDAEIMALSQNGQRLALIRPDKAAWVEVYSLEAGNREAVWQFDSKPRADGWLIFTSTDEILTITKGIPNSHIELRNVASGELVREITAPGQIERKDTAVSPDGRQLGIFDSRARKVNVLDLSTGAAIAELPIPSGVSQCSCLTFSADGQELAGLFSSPPKTKVASWVPSRREMVFEWSSDNALSAAAKSYSGPALEWLPDRSAFLIRGHLILDRQSSRVVWMLKPPTEDRFPQQRRWIDNDRLAFWAGTIKSRRLQIATLPWSRAARSLAALSRSESSLLQPGGSASLHLRLGETRGGSANSVKNRLTQAIAKALAANDITVAENQPVVLEIAYQEREGQQLQELKLGRGSLPFGSGAAPAGRSAQATRIVCELSLKRAVDSNVLWSDVIDIDPHALPVRGELTDESVREAALGLLSSRLEQQVLPFFVPQESGTDPLPAVIELPGAEQN